MPTVPPPITTLNEPENWRTSAQNYSVAQQLSSGPNPIITLGAPDASGNSSITLNVPVNTLSPSQISQLNQLGYNISLDTIHQQQQSAALVPLLGLEHWQWQAPSTTAAVTITLLLTMLELG